MWSERCRLKSVWSIRSISSATDIFTTLRLFNKKAFQNSNFKLEAAVIADIVTSADFATAIGNARKHL